MDVLAILVISIVFVGLFAAVLLGITKGGYQGTWESPQKIAGRRGEVFTTQYIKHVMSEEDIILTNVSISYEGKKTELDDVIINSKGIYIIEVKNYSGQLSGAADDYEWHKIKVTRAGNVYQDTVRNPIKQVKRQVYLLAKYLKKQNINVWVEGYVFFLNNNSPVSNDMVLRNTKDIDEAIHNRSDNHLSKEIIKQIVECLSDNRIV